MNKVFLYLYPIKDYMKMYVYGNEKKYEEEGTQNPLPVLNETIDKRYREKGYKIVYAMYPDREIYGIDVKDEDKIIYTDITYEEAITYTEEEEENFIFFHYPDATKLLEQLGDVDELVVGGFHETDCVKRVAETAYECGIPTLVDLDLTDLFFLRYKQKEYFDIDNYSLELFKKSVINNKDEERFKENYSSPVYGFYNKGDKKK